MECEKWVVHRVDVLARDAAFDAVGMKRAAVTVCGDAKRRVILQRVVRASLSCFWSQQLLPEGFQREVERRSRNGAIGRDGHALRLEPRLAEGVGPSTALCCLDVD